MWIIIVPGMCSLLWFYERSIIPLLFSVEIFKENLYPSWTGDNDLVVVLALVYTTTCGIMVGANLSGDLANPGKSLPAGTLGAMVTSLTT